VLSGFETLAEVDANGEPEREFSVGGYPPAGVAQLGEQLILTLGGNYIDAPTLVSLSDDNSALGSLDSQFAFASPDLAGFTIGALGEPVSAGGSVFASAYLERSDPSTPRETPEGRSGILQIAGDGSTSIRQTPGIGFGRGQKAFDVLELDEEFVTMSSSSEGTQIYRGADGNNWAMNQEGITLNDRRIGESEDLRTVLAHDGGLLLLFYARQLRETLNINAYQNSIGDRDVGLLKLDPLGRPQWLRVYGGGGDDVARVIKRTQTGYVIGGHSTSLDAVTPGSADIWLLKIGPDGRIESDRNGVDFCDVCIGSFGGEELASIVAVDVYPISSLSEPIQATITTEPIEVEMRSLPDNILESENTAQQCAGSATDLQELPVGAETQLLSVQVFGLGRVYSDPYRPSCDDLCEEPYLQDSITELTAVPAAGYSFSGWGGDCSGTDQVTDVGMVADRYCTATFVAENPDVFEILILGQGSVTESSTGFRCDSLAGQSSTICQASFPVGTTVFLQQSPAAGYQWTSWGSCTQNLGAEGCNVVVSESTPQIILEFSPVSTGTTFNLQIEVEGGTVVSTPAGIDCRNDICTASYPENQTVTLTATPSDSRVVVDAWRGDCSAFGDSVSGTIVMDADKSCSVFFRIP
jgi:hypothetical protein